MWAGWGGVEGGARAVHVARPGACGRAVARLTLAGHLCPWVPLPTHKLEKEFAILRRSAGLALIGLALIGQSLHGNVS